MSGCTEPKSSVRHTSTTSRASTRKMMLKGDWGEGVCDLMWALSWQRRRMLFSTERWIIRWSGYWQQALLVNRWQDQICHCYSLHTMYGLWSWPLKMGYTAVPAIWMGRCCCVSSGAKEAFAWVMRSSVTRVPSGRLKMLILWGRQIHF